MASPKEGNTVWQDSFVMTDAVNANPALKKVAEDWMNFATSPDYQLAVVVRSLGATPSNTKTKDIATPEEVAAGSLADLDAFWKNKYCGQLLKVVVIVMVLNHYGMKR